jgi:hypothetical protein
MGGRKKDIDELAKQGEQIEHDRKHVLTREQKRQAAERATMGAMSTTPLGGLRTYTGGLGIVAITAGPAFYFLTMGADESRMSGAEYWARIWAPFVFAVVAVLVVRVVALWVGRATYPGALAWFEALPFKVIGTDKMLCDGPNKAFENRLLVPAGANLERIASAVTGLRKKRISARVHNDAVIITIDVASKHDTYPVAPGTNYRGLRLIRLVVDDVLRAVHAEHPITSFELKSARPLMS